MFASSKIYRRIYFLEVLETLLACPLPLFFNPSPTCISSHIYTLFPSTSYLLLLLHLLPTLKSHLHFTSIPTLHLELKHSSTYTYISTSNASHTVDYCFPTLEPYDQIRSESIVVCRKMSFPITLPAA